jgi:hypothetical protein
MNKNLYFVIVLLFLSVATFAQVGPNSSDVFEPVTDSPVDGGIAILIAGGIGYGVKKLYDRKKK